MKFTKNNNNLVISCQLSVISYQFSVVSHSETSEFSETSDNCKLIFRISQKILRGSARGAKSGNLTMCLTHCRLK